MAHAHGGAPVFVKIAAARAFDIGPHVGRIREVEVGSEAVFDPRILAVDVIDLAVAAYNGVVAQKLMHCGDAQISRAPVSGQRMPKAKPARPIRLSASSKR